MLCDAMHSVAVCKRCSAQKRLNVCGVSAGVSYHFDFRCCCCSCRCCCINIEIDDITLHYSRALIDLMKNTIIHLEYVSITEQKTLLNVCISYYHSNSINKRKNRFFCFFFILCFLSSFFNIFFKITHIWYEKRKSTICCCCNPFKIQPNDIYCVADRDFFLSFVGCSIHFLFFIFLLV